MTKSLRYIALIVAVATGLSKLIGLLRQQIIASAFGISAAYDAYSYAYIFPGFLLILLGGINGPFHSAMITILLHRPTKERKHIVSAINTLTGTILCGVTGLLLVTADQLITLVGPGLNADLHRIAVIQLEIMAPISLFSGFIGLNFGILHVTEEFWLPSISPLLSSATVVTSIGLLWLYLGSSISSAENAVLGGSILAAGTLLGAIIQWLAQLPILSKQGFNKLTLIWDWSHPGVHKLLKVMSLATLSSGMLQINVLVDLFFASGIIGAAASLSYAGLLVQTPLGLVSSTLLIPLLPTLAKLSASKNYNGLAIRVRQGLILSNLTMFIFSGLLISLAYSIVGFIYARGAFDNSAKDTVSNLLIVYGIGMPSYLGRDVLVRVFYALGDSLTPLRFSVIGIVFNIIFDWILVGGPSPWGLQLPNFNCGASGLIIATVGVNIWSCIALVFALQSKIKILHLYKWALDSLWLLISAIIISLLAWQLIERLVWFDGVQGYILQGLFCGILSLSLYGISIATIGIQEVREFIPIMKLFNKNMN